MFKRFIRDRNNFLLQIFNRFISKPFQITLKAKSWRFQISLVLLDQALIRPKLAFLTNFQDTFVFHYFIDKGPFIFEVIYKIVFKLKEESQFFFVLFYHVLVAIFWLLLDVVWSYVSCDFWKNLLEVGVLAYRGIICIMELVTRLLIKPKSCFQNDNRKNMGGPLKMIFRSIHEHIFQKLT